MKKRRVRYIRKSTKNISHFLVTIIRFNYFLYTIKKENVLQKIFFILFVIEFMFVWMR